MIQKTIILAENNIREYEAYAKAERNKGRQPKKLSAIVRDCLDEYFKKLGL